MRIWITVALVLAPAIALAQPAGSGSAGSAAGSAQPPSTGSGAPESPPVPAPAPPAVDPAAARTACNAALNAADKAGNKIFIGDVAAVATGATATTELVKTAEGKSCLAALAASPEFQKSTSDTARQDAANQLAATVKKQHEDAGHAIAKNEKHVILAYAAMWLLSAAFVLFLWRRQQGLKTEIAQLRRDLEAASK